MCTCKFFLPYSYKGTQTLREEPWKIYPEEFPQGKIVQGLGYWVLPHSKPKKNLPSLLCCQVSNALLPGFQMGTRATRDHRSPVALAK